MKFLRLVFWGFAYFSLATVLAEAGILAVLWKRGQLSADTWHKLQVIALDVPVREIYERLEARSKPAKQATLSYSQLQGERILTGLDLDLREMSADKGLIDLHDLDEVLELEAARYAELKDEFDRRWQSFQEETTDSELQEVSRQIGTVSPELAKDQLLRILDDENLPPETALNHVVAIFRGLPLDKRKKIVLQFEGAEASSLHEVLRQIRLGMPQSQLIKQTRGQLQELSTR